MSAEDKIRSALSAAPRFEAIRAALAGAEDDVWVVGGAVRDALAGREVGDLDLATAGDPRRIAEAIRAALGGSAFELSDEFSTWRVTGEEGWSVDVAALRAPSIDADLALRDFTINAIAIPLGTGPPLDPRGGVADLERRRLRAASDTSFRDDPLRLMRAARIGAAFGLGLDAETAALSRDAAPAAGEPAGERRFAELAGMLSGPDPIRALELLDALEVTAFVLPQLMGLRDVGQSANHHLDVHEHTIEVLRQWLDVEADIPRYAGDSAAAVADALAEPLADGLTRRDGIRFAAIFHDIGKPATRTEVDGRVGFRGHDRVGAEMIVELCRDLRTSRRFAQFLAALTRHHLVLGFMTHERPLSRRRIWDYISLTGREAIDVTMLTVADRMSARGAGAPEGAIEAHLELAREMLAEIVTFEREGPAQPLLDGREIAELLGAEGDAIGEAVRELASAQFSGEVADRAQAEAHLVAWSASTRS